MISFISNKNLESTSFPHRGNKEAFSDPVQMNINIYIYLNIHLTSTLCTSISRGGHRLTLCPPTPNLSLTSKPRQCLPLDVRETRNLLRWFVIETMAPNCSLTFYYSLKKHDILHSATERSSGPTGLELWPWFKFVSFPLSCESYKTIFN